MATAAHASLPLSELEPPGRRLGRVGPQADPAGAVHWCDGSEAEIARAHRAAARQRRAEAAQPGRSSRAVTWPAPNPSDVARVEHLTFICTRSKEDAGPNNNWMDPAEAHAKMRELFAGCMKGRTLYVVPYCMGPIDSPLSRCGVEITDSAYVVLNMVIMTRMGRAGARAHRARRQVRAGACTPSASSIPSRRFIMHFPEELSIESFGSGYGGNALLGKKCHALRIASYQARTEGWLAEHMLIVGLQNPQGETHYIACAFPSACGKTNLAMLIPPDSMPGWKVFTVGDDIAWLHPGPDGRLWAINPEAGYFGVVPGTNPETNRNAYDMIRRDTLFTNVALTADNEPWWEGLQAAARRCIDWQGRPYDPTNGPAAHPNSRFTVSARNNPSYSPHAEDAERRADHRASCSAAAAARSRRWSTRRATGSTACWSAPRWPRRPPPRPPARSGVVRRDPMAMQPFCGYNFADYWQHWLNVGAKLKQAAADLPRELVPPRRAGQVPVAGLRRQPARARVDAGALRRQGRRRRRPPIGCLPRPQDLNTRAWTSTRTRSRRC